MHTNTLHHHVTLLIPHPNITHTTPPYHTTTITCYTISHYNVPQKSPNPHLSTPHTPNLTTTYHIAHIPLHHSHHTAPITPPQNEMHLTARKLCFCKSVSVGHFQIFHICGHKSLKGLGACPKSFLFTPSLYKQACKSFS